MSRGAVRCQAACRAKAPLQEQDAELLFALQEGLPIAPRPFAGIGAAFGLSEQQVVERLASFAAGGLVRRFGAVFDSRRLGYDSTLCAAAVPASDIERVAAILNPHPGITHSYQRDGDPSLWFTMTAPASGLRAEIETLSASMAPFEVISLPSVRVFKIGVVFDLREPGRGRRGGPAARREPPADGPAPEWGPMERAVVRAIQDGIPMSGDPFQTVAEMLGIEHGRLLGMLAEWTRVGILRRVGIIAYHRELGLAGNVMCVWQVEPARTEAAGRVVASFPGVSHCYERRPHARFPYNLFAMVHGRTREGAEADCARIAAAAGLAGGRMMASVREFKKASPRFFA